MIYYIRRSVDRNIFMFSIYYTKFNTSEVFHSMICSNEPLQHRKLINAIIQAAHNNNIRTWYHALKTYLYTWCTVYYTMSYMCRKLQWYRCQENVSSSIFFFILPHITLCLSDHNRTGIPRSPFHWRTLTPPLRCLEWRISQMPCSLPITIEKQGRQEISLSMPMMAR